MQEIMYLQKDDVQEVNERLECGWKVISMTAYSEVVTCCGGSGIYSGEFGAYVVLEKDQ